MSISTEGKGRRKFLTRAAVGTAALAGVSYLALLSARRTDAEFLNQLNGFQTSYNPPDPLPGLNDYPGVIHTRAPRPDTRERTKEFIAAARDAHLRFLMLTDANDPRVFGREPQGSANDVTVIRGTEIVKDGQHLLALGLTKFVDDTTLSLAELVAAIKDQNSLAFVSRPERFRDWNTEGIDGMEVYSVRDSARRNAWKAPLMFADHVTPGPRMPEMAFLHGPLTRPAAALARWDDMTQGRKLVGIAGNDAHLNFTLFDRAFEPWRVNFAFLQTHVIASRPDAPALIAALRAGHAYWSFGLLTDATGFQFFANGDNVRCLAGDSVALATRPVLSARTPQRAVIRLFRHGEKIREEEATGLDYVVQYPGVYRVEASLSIGGVKYPWIFSNPIYVA